MNDERYLISGLIDVTTDYLNHENARQETKLIEREDPQSGC